MNLAQFAALWLLIIAAIAAFAGCSAQEVDAGFGILRSAVTAYDQSKATPAPYYYAR